MNPPLAKIPKSSSNWLVISFVAIVAIATVWVPLNRNHYNGLYNNLTWDAEGYYAYLPATFVCGYEHFPRNTFVDGHPHLPDYPGTNKVYLKYTCGVAMLQWPFWLMAHGISNTFPQYFPTDGFHGLYPLSMAVGNGVYMALAFWLLWLAFRGRVSSVAFVLAALVFWTGTNLLYYSAVRLGYSHPCSFFLLAVLIWLTPQWLRESRWWQWGLLGVTLGMITLIRPVNAVVALYPLLYPMPNTTFKQRVFGFFQNEQALLALVLFLIPFIPQLLYWHHISGHYILYSYRQETFSNWNHPMLISVLFGTRTGLLVYAPVTVIALWAWWRFRDAVPSRAMAGIFMLSWYGWASWVCWWFGTSFGYRPAFEYYAFLLLPLALQIQQWLLHRSWAVRSLVALPLFLALVNIKMLRMYTGAWELPYCSWQEVGDLYYTAITHLFS
ncbi:MAG: hypothetical protein U0T84_06990 [Chitinophagales bacterium]